MKFTALGLAVFAGTAALLHSSVASGEPVKCFNDTALLELIGKLADKCDGFNLTCTPDCDDAMKCYFKEMGLWNPRTDKINWNKTKKEFETLYDEDYTDIADQVFEDFKKAEEESGNSVDHNIVARYIGVAKEYCDDAGELGIDEFKCEEECEA
ncbi:hypothetical protein GQ42DRAFT_159142 [Ramicandelaber brevisporus]|nr:hypothetical protein GQ42DRAFT_159142 [Ramicandelaber brevisporus]